MNNSKQVVSFTFEIHSIDSTENVFRGSECPLLVGDSYIILLLIQCLLLACIIKFNIQYVIRQ